MTSKPSGKIPEYESTVSVLHQHSLSPPLREKILAPFLVLAVGALLVGVGWVVRDHMHQEYRRVGKVQDVLALAARPAPAPGGLAGLLNPSDEPYVSFQTRGWQFWEGKAGITEDHYLRFPELQAASLEQLVKGERGAASLLVRVDLGRSEGNRFQVTSIERGGMESAEPAQTVEIYPVHVGQAPLIASHPRDGAYVEGGNIAYDRTSTFSSLPRIVVAGRLERTGDGLRIVSDSYNVVLSSRMDPGLRAVLEDVAREKPKARLKLFVDMEETFAWDEGGQPGRRQIEHEIGVARLAGVQLGKIFLVNGVTEAKPSA
jgi:hypothetical protein